MTTVPSKLNKIYEVYEVWLGRMKFATYHYPEDAESVVNATSASLGAHIVVTQVFTRDADQELARHCVTGVSRGCDSATIHYVYE